MSISLKNLQCPACFRILVFHATEQRSLSIYTYPCTRKYQQNEKKKWQKSEMNDELLPYGNYCQNEDVNSPVFHWFPKREQKRTKIDKHTGMNPKASIVVFLLIFPQVLDSSTFVESSLLRPVVVVKVIPLASTGSLYLSLYCTCYVRTPYKLRDLTKNVRAYSTSTSRIHQKPKSFK